MRKATLVFTAVLLIAFSVSAQHPAGAMAPGKASDMDCGAMMKEMHASSKAMDDRLQNMVDDMNKAKGTAKVDRMAAVINELTTQRKQMREQMMTMMPKMMGHMSQHMQTGMMSGMKSMSCPMMDAAAKSPDAPPAHKH